MKYLTVILLAFICSTAYAQDSTAALTWQSYVSYTMTGTKDTLDVYWGNDALPNLNTFMVYAKSSATDTITVYTMQDDLSTWCVTGLEPITADTVANLINATTTGTKYVITDPAPKKIRLIYGSDDGATCAVTVSSCYKP